MNSAARSSRSPAWPPFLLLTSIRQNLRERALQVGVDDYLAKSECDTVFRIRMRLILDIGRRGVLQPALNQTSILVVSRSIAIQTQLRTHLSKDGIQILGVSGVGEVLNQLRNKPADALLLDLDQGADALEILLSNLRNEPAFALLPVMVLASKADEHLLATMEHTIQDCLRKPLDGHESRHRVALLLRLAKVSK